MSCRYQCCSVPGCNYFSQSKEDPKALFFVHRPDLGNKTEEEIEHYRNLTNFLLEMRNFDGGQNRIEDLLHDESACICEKHFDRDDIIEEDKLKKRLKFGSYPKYNLPTKEKVPKVRIFYRLIFFFGRLIFVYAAVKQTPVLNFHSTQSTF